MLTSVESQAGPSGLMPAVKGADYARVDRDNLRTVLWLGAIFALAFLILLSRHWMG